MLRWLKEKLAGRELIELQILKMRISALEHWCSEFEDVSAAARWLQNIYDYPHQAVSPAGDISDFRAYLRAKKKISNQSQN